jgi:predicted metal-dependent hydrolase
VAHRLVDERTRKAEQLPQSPQLRDKTAAQQLLGSQPPLTPDSAREHARTHQDMIDSALVISMFLKTNRPAPGKARAEDGVAMITIAGSEARVRIRHQPRARRYNLRLVSASGEIVLTIPRGGTYDRGIDFLSRHEGWLAERLARHPQPVPFADGRLVPLRGVPHRLRVKDKVRGRVRLVPSAAVDSDETSSDDDGLPVLELPGGLDHAPRRLEDWLRREAHADLTVAVARYTRALAKDAAGLTVRDTRSRWGSCSSVGRLSFSWRLVLAPPFVLDYVAAHEVAHLKELNHSPRFWAILNDLSDDVDRAEAWLRDNGAELHRYGRDC